MVVKPCIKCGEHKPLMEFYPHKRMADGHLNMCKECSKRLAREFRAANQELYRAYEANRVKLPHRRALAAQVQARYYVSHAKRREATSKLRRAVLSGRIQPLPCWVCNAAKAEAHHPDYDSPLDVVWLCPAHHKQLHGEHKTGWRYLEAA